MQLTTPRPPTQRGGPSPLSSRGGSLAIAGLAALLAAAALLVFLRQYRTDLTDSTPVTVLEARALLPKGTPGQAIASDRLFREVRIRKSQLENGAITDPAQLRGKVASADIYPQHQLTAGDFSRATGSVKNDVSRYQRAMTVPVDGARAMIGKVEQGDRVDVVVSFKNIPGLLAQGSRVVARDVLVLRIPSSPGRSFGSTGANQDVTLRVDDAVVPVLAHGADNGKIWLVLRPAIGARARRSSAAAVQRALRGGAR